MQEDIDRLLLEAQRSRLSERRTEPRHAFVRPVRMTLPHGPALSAFSKDISAQGIGIVCETSISVGSLITLEIHSTKGAPVVLRSEVRWCDAFGKGWFLLGFKFIGVGVRTT